MAVRPVFVVSPDGRYCIRENVEFEFFQRLLRQAEETVH